MRSHGLLVATPLLHAAKSCSRLSLCWLPHSSSAAVVVAVSRSQLVTP
jgi:hypothetical protein